jgi:hypothetical protein
MGHAATADRLLIRSTNGCQAGTALHSRTDRNEDTQTRGQLVFESREQSTDTSLATTPDGTAATTESHRQVLISGKRRAVNRPGFSGHLVFR